MLVWTLRVPVGLRQKVMKHERYFMNSPCRVYPGQAYALSVGLPYNEYHPFAVFGHFLFAYEKRFYTQWKGTKEMLVDLYKDIELICERDGVESANWAIAAIFSQKMRWVFAPNNMLFNKNFFYKYVMPVADAMRCERQKGEAAEWNGERTKEAECVEVMW